MVQKILPCYKCQVHYKQHLTKYPITNEVLLNKDNLQDWVISIHNQVNINNAKNPISFDDAKTLNPPDTCIDDYSINNHNHNHNHNTDNSTYNSNYINNNYIQYYILAIVFISIFIILIFKNIKK